MRGHYIIHYVPALPSLKLRTKPSSVCFRISHLRSSRFLSTSLGTAFYKLSGDSLHLAPGGRPFCGFIPSTRRYTLTYPSLVFAAPGSSGSNGGLARVTSPRLVRPLQLPQRIIASSTGAITTTRDRPPVPIPSQVSPPPLTPSRSVPGLSSSSSTSTTTTIRSHGLGGGMSVPSSPTIPRSSTPTATATGLVKPKPRTGTGMTYKKSSYSSPSTIGPGGVNGLTGIGSGGGGGSLSSRVRPPMPLSLAPSTKGSLVPSASGLKGVSSGLAVRARAKTPVTPSTPTTPVGHAF